MATRRIREFLDGNNVRYVTISHSRAYTAQEVAESTHIPGRIMAKTVIVSIDGQLAMVIVPATRSVDLGAIRLARGTEDVRLADEPEFKDRFLGCQTGTVPPFGNLFGMDTFIDPSLADQVYIAFPAGTHTDAIVMHFNDYLRLVRPVFMEMASDLVGAV